MKSFIDIFHIAMATQSLLCYQQRKTCMWLPCAFSPTQWDPDQASVCKIGLPTHMPIYDADWSKATERLPQTNSLEKVRMDPLLIQF